MPPRRRRSAKENWLADLDEGDASRRKVRQGEAGAHVVDLHGHTLEAAKRRLSGELARCRAGGRSPVRIVTGKGHGSLGGTAVLAPGIEAWLKGPEGRSFGVHSIRRIAGGGALEVTLRRGEAR